MSDKTELVAAARTLVERLEGLFRADEGTNWCWLCDADRDEDEDHRDGCPVAAVAALLGEQA